MIKRKKIKQNTFSLSIIKVIFFMLVVVNTVTGQNGLTSIETGYTISNVRVAHNNNDRFIVANSYEGRLLGIDYDGTILWTNELSGFMNHDVWCGDITGDNQDEILVANADGNIYCLNSNGELLWQFKQNEAPMFSVCTITKNNDTYVVGGGLDLSIYYLNSAGELVKEIPSATYSQENSWGDNAPPDGLHLANFIRKITQADGTEDLVVHGCLNTNATNGSLYFFEALADLPYQVVDPLNKKPVGEVRVTDYFGDGQEQIFMGSSTARNTTDLTVYTAENQEVRLVDISDIINQLGGFGYRVVQTEVIPKGSSYEYFCLVGNYIALIPPSLNLNNTEILGCDYSFNDLWLDRTSQRIILASSQSGGSSIHLIDYTHPNWKNAYRNINPPGKIQQILNNTQAVRNQLENFTPPQWERSPHPVYFVSDLANNNSNYIDNLAADINSNYNSPRLLGTYFAPNVQDPESWNRDTMSNEFYRSRRDTRKNYTLTQNQVTSSILPQYNNHIGLSYWGGHGNDPYFYSLQTLKALLDGANNKKTVLIYPELQNDSPDFNYVAENLMYPLATYARTRNTQIHIRSKHIFWQGAAYGSNWRRMASGEFSDIFVPSMEQTGDKSMDLTIAGRMGYWLGGSVDQWGDRAVPDNPSYYRLRQFSHQRLPNHHLRQTIYAAASGATHFNNFRVDVEYTSLVWELIAKGALYVPKRNELLHISPVHLSMTDEPDPYYLNEGSNVKWITFYDEAAEENNRLVFSRLNGSWPGAPLTDWDFSTYAANEKERRLNFIPAYNNGLVLITPVQNGMYAEDDLPRGKLVDHLHPFYRTITKEYITDGRQYLSADGNQSFAADTYYTTVKSEIETAASLLPVTVEGDVGWVVAQTDSLHLRLTIIDGGYINPSEKEVVVHFNSIAPSNMRDLLNGEIFDVDNSSSVTVTIPCGMFRFLDIELSEKLVVSNSVIEPAEDPIAFSVFPNPTNKVLNLNFTGKGREAAFQIVDIQGKVVKSHRVPTVTGVSGSVTFEVGDLANGSYIIRWVGENQSMKFVKSE